MDAEQINKRIHEWLGKCWHESKDTDRSTVTCEKCGSSFGGGYGFAHYLPDYTTDLNAVREAELKCIEEFGEVTYLDALSHRNATDKGPFTELTRCAIAPADKRAQAVCDVLEATDGRV